MVAHNDRANDYKTSNKINIINMLTATIGLWGKWIYILTKVSNYYI